VAGGVGKPGCRCNCRRGSGSRCAETHVHHAQPPIKAAVDGFAAACSDGLGCLAALYPLDTIKTRLQAMSSGGGLRALLQSGGGKALYAGLVGNLAGVVPASAIFMGVYEPVKGATGRRVRDDRQFLAPLAGGVAAGFAASVVRVPTEVVKQRMQTGACCVSHSLSPGSTRHASPLPAARAGEFRGALQAVRGILGREGVRGLFAGYGSFLLRDLPFDAIEFVAYEQLKKSYKVR